MSGKQFFEAQNFLLKICFRFAVACADYHKKIHRNVFGEARKEATIVDLSDSVNSFIGANFLLKICLRSRRRALEHHKNVCESVSRIRKIWEKKKIEKLF